MGEVSEIFNWRELDTHITSSGQPSAAQFSHLKSAGVKTIINLAPEDHQDALPNERKLLDELGFNYTNIPVPFTQPSDETYNLFVSAIQADPKDRMHIHCIFNARVTAYWHRYICEYIPADRIKSAAILDSIWRPGKHWAVFIGDEHRANKDHEYSSLDY
ncbi:protein tyrosine phosphatase family protein [Maritalea porphyrae]|uniref:Phosphatase n=1 Tax=Maritalea porphyrae TaxID=880732 RepID=A0ABQ5UMX3_9HYPH|nr:protein tyrosine phosphatase family protein [Maritalea porphyrae]GLQ16497.1 hypothetical protein GCM10007879_07460 [Maritalea porphyrae]